MGEGARRGEVWRIILAGLVLAGLVRVLAEFVGVILAGGRRSTCGLARRRGARCSEPVWPPSSSHRLA